MEDAERDRNKFEKLIYELKSEIDENNNNRQQLTDECKVSLSTPETCHVLKFQKLFSFCYCIKCRFPGLEFSKYLS